MPNAFSQLEPTNAVLIERLSAGQVQVALIELIRLLQATVTKGASIGFLLPLQKTVLHEYWRKVIREIERGTRIFLVARLDEQIVGTIQLELATKQNARHRAEVQKLIVHPRFRNRGIGTTLLATAEEIAKSLDRTLLTLEVRQGDPAERLYQNRGYTAVGSIPNYARNPQGRLEAAAIYYRQL